MTYSPKFPSKTIVTVKNNWFPTPSFDGNSGASYMQHNAKNVNLYPLPVQPNRKKQDILSWREAVQEAERAYFPYRVKMQSMYIDTILNDHVQACMSKRKNLSLLKEFMVCGDDGNEDVRATKLLKGKWFSNLMGFILDAQFYGYSFIGLGDFINKSFPQISLLKRDHIVVDYQINNNKDPYYADVPYMPDGLHFLDKSKTDDNGISYHDWTLWITTPTDIGQSSVGYGLLYYVAKNEIYLRNNTGWNADYIEVYGQPLAVAKSPKKEDGQNGERARLEQALRDRGSNSYIILDVEDDVELITGKGASGKGNEVYDNFEERLQKGISKILLGHADALDSTPGKLGAQGGEKDGEAKDAVSKSLQDIESIDCSFIEDWMNSLVIPKLINIGLPIPLGKQFKFKNDRERDEVQEKKNSNGLSMANIAKIMKEAGLKMDAKYFEEQTEIPCEQIEETTEDPFDGSDGKKFASDIKNKLELSFKH